jgi:heme A synthase
MSKSDFENKSLVWIILLGYIFNLLFGWAGVWLDPGSRTQILLFQIGTAFAISASTMAARYTGLRGQQVTASAYILLGITHGISLAALSKAGINADREVTMVMPMIPSLIFMFWCSLYPLWLRLSALIPTVLFTLVYVNVQSGDAYLGWTLYSGYGILQINEVLWGIYLFLDWKKVNAEKMSK